MAGCAHEALRLITPEEEPDVQERSRRPWTCDDCTAVVPMRMTQAQATRLILDRLRAVELAIMLPKRKESADAPGRRR